MVEHALDLSHLAEEVRAWWAEAKTAASPLQSSPGVCVCMFDANAVASEHGEHETDVRW